ncbi:MAG: hypothetical protein R3B40_29495 [Polyangiales bacterium]
MTDRPPISASETAELLDPALRDDDHAVLQLHDRDLTQIDWHEPLIEQAVLVDVDIGQVTCEGGTLRDVRFERAMFGGVTIRQTTFENVTFDQCELNLSIVNGEFRGCTFIHCTFHQVVSRSTAFHACSWEGGEVGAWLGTEDRWDEVVVEGSSLAGGTFSNVIWCRTQWINAKLIGIQSTGCNYYDVSFHGSEIADCEWLIGEWIGTSFRTCTIYSNRWLQIEVKKSMWTECKEMTDLNWVGCDIDSWSLVDSSVHNLRVAGGSLRDAEWTRALLIEVWLDGIPLSMVRWTDLEFEGLAITRVKAQGLVLAKVIAREHVHVQHSSFAHYEATDCQRESGTDLLLEGVTYTASPSNWSDWNA